MTIRDQLRRAARRGDTAARGSPIEHRDVSADEIRNIRARRQRKREMEQMAGPEDGREMFKLAEESARAQAPVDTDLNPGNPEAVGLMADTEGMMAVDNLATGRDAEGDMVDLAASGQTGESFLDFVLGAPGGDD